MNYTSYIFTIFFVMLCNHNQACASQNSWLEKIYISSSFFTSCLKSIPSFLQNIGNKRYTLSKENQTHAIIAGSFLVSSYCLYLWRQNSVLKTENKNLSQKITEEKKEIETLKKKYDAKIEELKITHNTNIETLKKEYDSKLIESTQTCNDTEFSNESFSSTYSISDQNILALPTHNPNINKNLGEFSNRSFLCTNKKHSETDTNYIHTYQLLTKHMGKHLDKNKFDEN